MKLKSRILSAAAALALTFTQLGAAVYADNGAAAGGSAALPASVSEDPDVSYGTERSDEEILQGIPEKPVSAENYRDAGISLTSEELEYAAAKTEEFLRAQENYGVTVSERDAGSIYSTDFYYNQLSDMGKQVYDELDKLAAALYKSGDDIDTDMLTAYFDFSADSKPGTINAEDKAFAAGIEEKYRDEITAATRAFYFSNPQYFFLKNGWLDEGGLSSKSSYGNSATITYSMMYGVSVYSDFMDGTERTKYKNSIENTTESWLAEMNKFSTPLEKEKWLYEKMCDTIKYDNYYYDPAKASKHHQSMAGAVVDNICVCNGYAMTAEYFLNAAGIETVFILGNGHAWVDVKLYGKWYELDVTWIDTETNGKYDTQWVNKSHSTFIKNDQEYAHVYDSDFYTEFTYPQCTSDTVTAVTSTVTFTKPSKTDYFVGQDLDVDGAKFTALYSDGETETYTVKVSDVTGFDNTKAGKQTLSVICPFDEKEYTFDVTVSAAELESVNFDFPKKTEYNIGDELDVDGAKFTALYSDGETETYTVKVSDVTGFDNTKAGTQTLTVICPFDEKEYTFDVTVSAAELESVNFDFPKKTEYKIGDELDVDGAEFTAVYSDGSTDTYTVKPEDVTGFDNTKAGKQTLSVICPFNEEEYTFEIEVAEQFEEIKLVSAEFTEPSKKNYYIGDELNVDGAKFTALYSDGSTDEYVIKASDVTGFDNTKEGTQTLTVICPFDEKEYTFDITVFEPEEIRPFVSIIFTEPTKKEYNIGDELDVDGAKFTAYYSDGTYLEYIVKVSKVMGFDNTKEGTQTLSVKCPYNLEVYTFEVTVIKPQEIISLVSVEFTEPSKKDYYIGDELDVDGAKFTAHYSDGTDDTYIIKASDVKEFDNTKPGKQTLKVLCPFNAEEYTFDVTVTQKPLTRVTFFVNGREDENIKYLDDALAYMSDMKSNNNDYVITLNADDSVNSFKLPSKARSVAIIGNGNTIFSYKKISATAKYPLRLENVKFSADSVSIKGKKDYALELKGDFDTIDVISGFGTVTLNGTLTTGKTFNVPTLRLLTNSVLRPGVNSNVKIVSLYGAKDSAIDFANASKPKFKPVKITKYINLAQAGVRISVKNAVAGTQLFNTKVDVKGYFDLSASSPDLQFYRKGSKVYVI